MEKKSTEMVTVRLEIEWNSLYTYLSLLYSCQKFAELGKLWMAVRSHIGSKAPFQFLHVQVHQNCRKLNYLCRLQVYWLITC
jgi:hypothetical protein